jgi:hypothetical protein
MFRPLLLGIFVLVGSTCAVAGTPVPNDACEDAIEISGQGIFAFENADATSDHPYDIAHDVWYCWTSSCSGAVTLDTCGGTAVDTRIGIRGECQCPPTTWVAFDDDDCVYQSSVTFEATVGSSYLIQIGTNPQVHGSTGTFTIQCGEAPEPPCAQVSENCQGRDGWNALTSNRTEFVVADNFTPGINGDITEICWWGTYSDDRNRDWSAPDSFELRYYLDEGGLPGAMIAGPFSQVDSTLSVQGPTRTYRLLADVDLEYEYTATHDPVPVLAGKCYWVEISNEVSGASTWLWEVAPPGDGRAVQDGKGGGSPDGYDPRDAVVADLSFCLNLPLGNPQTCRAAPINDACVDSLPIYEGETFFDTSGALTDGPEQRCLPSEECCWFPLGDHQIHRDIWFDYVAPCSGLLTAYLCDSPFDTKVAIYDGLTCPPTDAATVCDDDGCDDVLTQQSQAGRPVTQGHGYKIRVGGYIAPLQGDCGWRHDTPGCSDAVCETAACAVYASCCDGSYWDWPCIWLASALCAGRSGPGTIQLELTALPPADLDLADYAAFTKCATSLCDAPPCDPPLYDGPCCLTVDFDNDGDIDLADFARFLSGFDGP